MNSDSGAFGPANSADGPNLEVHRTAVPATAAELPGLRELLAEWAARVGLGAQQIEDVTLAGYEALANAATHAYSGEQGTLGLRACYRPESRQVEVVVTDWGHWRPQTATVAEQGHGLVLIRSLTDHVEVTTGESGTTVRMCWTVPSLEPAAVVG